MKDRKWLWALMGLNALAADTAAQEVTERQNVLLIVCDDLRPQLGCYGHDYMKTPNIDRLAAGGVVFTRSFCNVPVSGASRASMLTGMRPTRNLFEHWNCRIDQQVPEAVTLNRAFSEAGYITLSNGKVFHHQDEDSNRFWEKVMPYPDALDYRTEENHEYMRLQREAGIRKRGMFYEAANKEIYEYMDGKTLQESLEDLETLATRPEPFFMAVGFVRPHLPFVAPREYWDIYNREQIRIPENYVLHEGHNIPDRALTHWGELMAYRGIPEEGPLDAETAVTMIHGYYACVSFIDALIGRLLDRLEELGLAGNTTVVLVGDHGWNLGEHGMWCKHSIMETSLHAPIVIRTPGGLRGHRTGEVVEYVDIYPTLCELTGIPKPMQLEGESLITLLTDKNARSKGYAIARWQHGFTYIDRQYSYTEWWDANDRATERLLFDHTTDPDENYNVAEQPQYRHLTHQLSLKLKERRGLRFLN